MTKPYILWRQNQLYVKERKLRGDVELQEFNPFQVFNDVIFLPLTLLLFLGVRKIRS